MAGRLRVTIPQFTVPDVVSTAEYYRDVFGFTISGYWKDPPVFAIVEREDVEIFFNKPSRAYRPERGAFPVATTCMYV